MTPKTVKPGIAKLAEFIEARLVEDEQRADRGNAGWFRWDPGRAHREVAAKRAILAAYEGIDDTAETQHYSPDYYVLGDAMVKALAAVYSDHPDYDPGLKL